MKSNSAIPLAQFINSRDARQPSSSLEENKLTAQGWIESVCKVRAAYIHIPFCFHKCHYCDFFSIAGADDKQEDFVEGLIKELKYVGSIMEAPLKTVFIGGGTPTLLEPSLLARLLHVVAEELPLANDCEWTVEANPETVTSEVAHVLASEGVNRISVGAQSFNLENLKTLERWHEPNSVSRAINFFLDAGIENYNLDLIYAIPNQTIEQVESDLQLAIDLEPKHLSCYALVYEPNTPLRTRLERGEIKRAEDELEADMFGLVRDTLGAAGYRQYEISNFAAPNYECRHNLVYWKNESWWPFGPSASGHLDGRRWKNVPRLSDYLKTSSLPLIEDVELLNDDRRAGEEFMLGLRVLAGIEQTRVKRLIGMSDMGWRAGVIDGFVKKKLLQWANGKLSLTDAGILVADTVISSLLMHDEVITDTSK